MDAGDAWAPDGVGGGRTLAVVMAGLGSSRWTGTNSVQGAPKVDGSIGRAVVALRSSAAPNATTVWDALTASATPVALGAPAAPAPNPAAVLLSSLATLTATASGDAMLAPAVPAASAEPAASAAPLSAWDASTASAAPAEPAEPAASAAA